MLRPIQVICSDLAASSLSRNECSDLVQDVWPLAQKKDRGVHEGLTFAFDAHGQEWKIVVDLQQGWVKHLGR